MAYYSSFREGDVDNIYFILEIYSLILPYARQPIRVAVISDFSDKGR